MSEAREPVPRLVFSQKKLLIITAVYFYGKRTGALQRFFIVGIDVVFGGVGNDEKLAGMDVLGVTERIGVLFVDVAPEVFVAVVFAGHVGYVVVGADGIGCG